MSNTTTGASANDNQVLISLNESGSADTDATPNVVLVAAKITDAEPNALASDQTFSGTAGYGTPCFIIGFL